MMKRILAVLLSVLMLFSLASCASDSGKSTDSANSEKSTESNMSNNTNGSQGSVKDPDVNVSADGVTTVTGGTEENPEAVSMKYDDRYVFPDAIDTIETVSVTSKQTGTEKEDLKVLRKKSNVDRDVAVAVGVGQAKVTLKNGGVYLVTVSPAPISVLLITGQSNGEGSTDDTHYTESRNQSVVCEEGQIYSTYAWSTTGHSRTVAGLSSSVYLLPSNAKNFVADSLTSNQSRGGTTLEYSLNSLSAAGRGKTGFDSGLAWQWHEETGDKVWVVNCAAGSSAIEAWQPDFVPAAGETTPAKMNRYDMCVALMENVRATMDAEVAAGHYELKSFVYFWLQGESNKSTSQEDYYEMFETLHSSLKEDVKLTGDKTLDGCGIIMVRAFQTSNPSIDTVDNGPRLAQKQAIAATSGPCADVFLACIANDEWISNSGITEYWESKYPNSEYPFQVHSQAYENPLTIDVVHTGVHYLQPGYNEIGIVAATNAVEHLR